MANPDAVNPKDLAWKDSPTRAPGCSSKKIFMYDSGAYTCHYRFAPGAAYPPVHMVGQPCELYVTSGTLLINDTPIPSGSWAQVMPNDDTPTVFSSNDGCEVIGIVRGGIRQAVDSHPGKH